MTVNSCPHCGEKDCVAEVAINNAETYGSRTFRLTCTHCGKAILATLDRVVRVVAVRKGTHQEDDWGIRAKP